MSGDEAAPIKVLLVTPDFPPKHGGIQRLLHRITMAMPHAEVRVLTLDGEDAAAFDAANPQVTTRVKTWSGRAVVRNAAFNASAIARAPKWRPDIILNGHVVSGPAAVVLAKRYKVPNVLYTYGKEVEGRPGMTAWTLKRSTGAVAITQFTRGLMLKACGGALPRPVAIVHPGVEVPRQAVRVDYDRPTILTVSRLRDFYKGHDVILEAMPAIVAAVPDVQWIVIGDGEIRGELERRRDEMGLQASVTFLGAVDDATKDAWMARAEVFCMPSRYPKDEIGGEGFGIVYMEAAVWGVPSISGNAGGPAEAVIDGLTGLTVEPESSEEVAAAAIRLLSDPDYARKLGVQARERAEESFTWDKVGAQLEAVLRSAASGTL